MAKRLEIGTEKLRLSMKVGDMVQYAETGVEENAGLIVDTHFGAPGERFQVSVLWDDGEIWIHDAEEFIVISGKMSCKRAKCEVEY